MGGISEALDTLRELSVLTLYYFSSYRTLGSGNTEAPISNICFRCVGLHAEDPGWPAALHTETATLFIGLSSDTRIVTLCRSGGWFEKRQGSITEHLGIFSQNTHHPPTHHHSDISWLKKDVRIWTMYTYKALQKTSKSSHSLLSFHLVPALPEKPNLIN